MLRRATRAMALSALPALFALPALLWHGSPAAQLVEEVPFITTPDNVTLAMLQLAQVNSRDHVIDLGSGDGRIVITAARRFGASGLGVEIVPELVAQSRAAADKAGVGARVRFLEQDLFKTDLSAATVITMYLLPEVNLQLRPALLQLAPGTRIVSHDWDMGDWQPDESLTVDAPDKKIGREKKSRLLRWVVPARAEGLWCSADGASLSITQQYQVVQARWQQGAQAWSLQGRLDGWRLRLLGAAPGPMQWQVEGDRLLASAAATPRPRRPAAALALTRATGAACGG